LANLKTAETAETANGAGLRCRASDQEKQGSQSGRGKAAEAVGFLREKQRNMVERTPEESCVLKQSCNVDHKVKIVTTRCSKISGSCISLMVVSILGTKGGICLYVTESKLLTI
jgi:hypothetical protein